MDLKGLENWDISCRLRHMRTHTVHTDLRRKKKSKSRKILKYKKVLKVPTVCVCTYIYIICAEHLCKAYSDE